jgi:hypothetical protein
MLGTFETDDFDYMHKFPQTGVFLSDSAMFQRRFPDDVLKANKRQYKTDECEANATILPVELKIEDGDMLAFISSAAFPLFYGLTMPLLKGGLPIRPVQLENITRYPSYLDDYKLLVLSYEFMKPATADINTVLANYVVNGGILCYYGDGTDPFHAIESWWNSGKINDASPLEHLLRYLGLPKDTPNGIYPCGKGKFSINRINPAALCLSSEAARQYREEIELLLGVALDKNNITLRRGPYLITAVMNECVSSSPIVHKGHFVDMLSTDFRIINEKKIETDNYSLLFDLNYITNENLYVIGTSARVNELSVENNRFLLRVCGPDKIRAHIRLRLPAKPMLIEAKLTPVDDSIETGISSSTANKATTSTIIAPNPIEIIYEWDEYTHTVLLSYDSAAGDIEISGIWEL